jgi:tetratricopeptide (TPR) repeat protein
MSTATLDCFFVSPFGDKAHQVSSDAVPHFELIRPAIKEIMESFPDAPIKLRRADEIANVGSIQETFIIALHKADIVVADLTATGNGNIYYELGIRFALRRSITIPIWQTGTPIPADLQGVLGIQYDGRNPAAQREQFFKFLRSRLAGALNDSPVYKVLPELEIVDAKRLQSLTTRIEELEKELNATRLSNIVQLSWDEAEKTLLKGDVGAALDTLKLAYGAAPKNLALATRYGQLLSRAERHDQAIAVLDSAVALASETEGPRFISHRELGMAYKRAGKAQLAIDWLGKAAAENPRDSDTHGIIGGIFKDRYDIDEAIEAYARGFDGDPKSTYCLLNILCLLAVRGNIGDKIRFKRLLPLADELTLATLESSGADHWAIYDRAHFLLYAGKQLESTHLFTKAISLTKTIGELRSARKNLDLLEETESNLAGLQSILRQFSDAEATLPR